MGFFAEKNTKRIAGPSDELLHSMECKLCPLDKITTNHNPHMPASGSKEPLIYILGEGPEKEEDFRGKQFVGPSGKLLRAHLPEELLPQIRWNNVSRTRAPKNATPTRIVLECCRPSVERDITATKPKAIFGFGDVPLKWVSGHSRITDWRGRRMPVNIAEHKCWYYAFAHPSYLLRHRPEWNKDKGYDEIGSEDERAFMFDIRRAIAELNNLPEPVVHTKVTAEEGVEIYNGNRSGDYRNLLSRLRLAIESKEAGLDFETAGWRPYAKDAELLTIGIGLEDVSFAFAWDHPEAGWNYDQSQEIIKLFHEFLTAKKCVKYVHNLMYEFEWIGVYLDKGIIRSSTFHCSLMQASTLDERGGEREDEKKKKGKNTKGPLSLDWLIRQYFGISLKGLSKVNVQKLRTEPVDAVLKYNAMDAKYHRLLGLAQKAELKRQGLWRVYKRGLGRIATCVLTQIEGMPTNPNATERLKLKYEKGEKKQLIKIHSDPLVDKFKYLTKHTFDQGSYPDMLIMLRDVIKSKAGWTIDKKTKKERYSTKEDVLEKIGLPLTLNIIKLRKLQKKQSTYLYDKHIWPDGLIHANFHPGFFTETFRISSTKPNLQNIPKREAGNQEVRLQLVAPEGYSIVAIDYGQIEARVIAMFCKDPAFVKSMWDRVDVHMKWAEILAQACPERIGGKQFLTDKEVMKTFRTDIKNQWTFPLFFGARMESAAGYLSLPSNKIETEFRDFKREYQGAFEWQREFLSYYNKHGYVDSLFGRRRRAPLTKNQVFNNPVQCTMAEMVMDAMTTLSIKAQKENDWHFQPRLMIHDDLTFIFPDNRLDYYLTKTVKIMLEISKFDFVNVPITLEVSIGKTLYPYDPKHPEKCPDGMFEIFRASSDNPNYEWSKGYDEWANAI